MKEKDNYYLYEEKTMNRISVDMSLILNIIIDYKNMPE